MSSAVVVKPREVFASEIAEAKRLGFEVQVAQGDASLAVRLVPVTLKAKRAAAIAAPDRSTPLIEATCVMHNREELLDRMAETLGAALGLARDALA